MLAALPLATNLPESQQLSWDMAKQIIQTQSNLTMLLVAIATFLMVASWARSIYLNKHELKRAVDSLESKMIAREEEHFTELSEKVKAEVAGVKQEIEESVAERMTLFDADKARLFAITAFNAKLWENEALWWAVAIEGFAKVGNPHILRIAVKHLNTALKKCKKLEGEKKERIKSKLSFIPPILQEERKEIEDKLDKLPKEKPKEPQVGS